MPELFSIVSPKTLGWIAFNVFVLFMLLLDLVVFHRDSHEVKLKEALGWSAFWISLAAIFNVGVWRFGGQERAVSFLAGYLLEESMSMDNLFVFLLIFNYFKVPKHLQHRVLFWGILGAIIMRGIFIGVGVALLQRFYWVIYVLGALLVYSGVMIFLQKETEVEPEKNWVIRIFHKLFRVTKNYEGGHFWVRQGAQWFATPLFVVLLMVETTDLIFAIDSIPAVMALTSDPFIIYTSNIFAILGLRAMFFALAGVMNLFVYLNYGLGIILIAVGLKMLAEHWVHVPVAYSLVFIVTVLAGSILLSVWFPKTKRQILNAQKS